MSVYTCIHVIYVVYVYIYVRVDIFVSTYDDICIAAGYADVQ